MTPSSEPSPSLAAATAEAVPLPATSLPATSSPLTSASHAALDAEVRATAMLLLGALAVIGGIAALVSGLLTLMGTA